MIYVLFAYLSYPFLALLSRHKKRSPDSVLVFQTAGPGEMICTTPVFREIKKAYPYSRLGVVADPEAAPLLKYNPHVDEVIEFDRTRSRGLSGALALSAVIREKGYESALVLFPNVTNLLIPFWAMIPRRFSVYPDFAGQAVKWALALSTGVEYHLSPRMCMETYLKGLRHIGIKDVGIDKEVYESPESAKKAFDLIRGDGPFIGLMLGPGGSLEDWGAEYFISLAARVLEGTGLNIMVLGPESEKETGARIRALSAERVQDLTGFFNMVEMPEAIKRLSLAIGADSWPIYMADALGVPVIDVIGPCNPDDRRPVGKNGFVLCENGLECRPCSFTFSPVSECRQGHRKCIAEITPEQVFRCIVKNFAF